jgi:hypothetical protein
VQTRATASLGAATSAEIAGGNVESAYQYCGGDPVGKVDPSGETGRVPPPDGFQHET